MTLDDPTVIAVVCSLAAAVVGLWALLRRRYECEVGGLRAELKDALARIKQLEDRSYRDMRDLTDRYDASISKTVDVIRELAKAVNQQSLAISKSAHLNQPPAPHPASDIETDALYKNQS